MKTILLALALFATNQILSAQGTAFTYQGRLDTAGTPANGRYDLTFTLFNASSGGGTVAGPLTNSATAVSNGLFIVTLDFGTGMFDGNARWLEIAVRTNGASSSVTLAPRQALTPAPYAVYSASAGSVPASAIGGGTANISITGNATTATSATNLIGDVTDAQIPANMARLNGTNAFTGTNTFAEVIVATNANNVFAGTFTGDGSGLTGVAGGGGVSTVVSNGITSTNLHLIYGPSAMGPAQVATAADLDASGTFSTSHYITGATGTNAVCNGLYVQSAYLGDPDYIGLQTNTVNGLTLVCDLTQKYGVMGSWFWVSAVTNASIAGVSTNHAYFYDATCRTDGPVPTWPTPNVLTNDHGGGALLWAATNWVTTGLALSGPVTVNGNAIGVLQNGLSNGDLLAAAQQLFLRVASSNVFAFSGSTLSGYTGWHPGRVYSGAQYGDFGFCDLAMVDLAPATNIYLYLKTLSDGQIANVFADEIAIDGTVSSFAGPTLDVLPTINIAYDHYKATGGTAAYHAYKANLTNAFWNMRATNNLVWVSAGEIYYYALDQGLGRGGPAGYNSFATLLRYDCAAKLAELAAADGDVAASTNFLAVCTNTVAALEANFWDATNGLYWLYPTTNSTTAGHSYWASAYSVHLGSCTFDVKRAIVSKLMSDFGLGNIYTSFGALRKGDAGDTAFYLGQAAWVAEALEQANPAYARTLVANWINQANKSAMSTAGLAGISLEAGAFDGQGNFVPTYTATVNYMLGPARMYAYLKRLVEIPTAIATVDAGGVALAAIQGLNQKLEEELKAKDARIAKLEGRLAELEKAVKSLAQR